MSVLLLLIYLLKISRNKQHRTQHYDIRAAYAANECLGFCTEKKNVRSIECGICSDWVHEVCASFTAEAFVFLGGWIVSFGGRIVVSEAGEPNQPP